MDIYKNKRVRFQKDFAFDEFLTIRDALGEVDIEELEGIVAVLSNKGKLYELNLTAAIFWELIGDGSNIDGLSKNLADIFELGVDDLKNDLNELSMKLESLDLINVSN